MRNRSQRMRGIAWLLCAVALALLALGCGGDDGGGGSSDDDFLDFGSFELPYDNAEECIAFSQAKNDVFDSTACACENCLDIMQECDVLDGCVAIRDCAFATGCRGAFECYLLPDAPCVEVIDDYGNASVASALTLALGECEMKTGCLE